MSKYFDFQDVSKRSTVAVVVDDPEGKKQVSISSNIFRHLKFKKLCRFFESNNMNWKMYTLNYIIARLAIISRS